MFTKSNLLGTLVGTVTNVILMWIYMLPIFWPFWDKHHNNIEGLHKEPPENLWIILSMILMGFILSTIYGKLKEENHNFMGGFEIAGWIAAFYFFGINLLQFGYTNHYDLTGTLVDGIIGIIMFGISGGLIALVYKATSK
jgi:hypothetical protein